MKFALTKRMYHSAQRAMRHASYIMDQRSNLFKRAVFNFIQRPTLYKRNLQSFKSAATRNAKLVYKPFAGRGHVVQNTPYWNAKEFARLQNKTQFTKKGFFPFVLHFPVELLRRIMAYFVSRDLILQRAY